jgi:hypothetical protein
MHKPVQGRMKMQNVCLSILLSLFPLAAQAGHIAIDKEAEIHGVQLKSGKDDSIRHYQAHKKLTFKLPLAEVKKNIISFTDRCNDAYRSKRLYTDQSKDCKFHHDHLIETFEVRNISQQGWTKLPGEIDRFLLGRTIYNRGHSEYYELVQLVEGVNEQGQPIVTVIQTMLDDQEVRLYTEPKFKRDSAFQKTISTHILVETAPGATDYRFDYQAETSHWLLSRELAVPQVFSAISQSINVLVGNLGPIPGQERDLASRQ